MKNDDYSELASAYELANRLRALVDEYSQSALDFQAELEGDDAQQQLPDPSKFAAPASARHIRGIIDQLAEALSEAAYSPDLSQIGSPTDGDWAIGRTIYSFPVRRIHGGFVQPLFSAPIVRRVPLLVVEYLIIKIPDESDILQRESHGHWGWHYHYLASDKRRSDTVLYWDTRASHPRAGPHPLYQNRHGEKNAKFKARPERWMETKRKSIHGACTCDLEKRALSEYCPAPRSASLVWPPTAKATPIVPSVKP